MVTNNGQCVAIDKDIFIVQQEHSTSVRLPLSQHAAYYICATGSYPLFRKVE